MRRRRRRGGKKGKGGEPKLARGEHGVFHGTSSEGALIATFQENGERSDWRSLQVCAVLESVYVCVSVCVHEDNNMLHLVCYCVHAPGGAAAAGVSINKTPPKPWCVHGTQWGGHLSPWSVFLCVLAAKSMYFVASKHKPRGSAHTTLPPQLQPSPVYPLKI